MKKIAVLIVLSLLIPFMAVNAERYRDNLVKGEEGIIYLPSHSLNWSLHINGAGDGLTFNQTQALIANAYDVWQNDAYSDISFSYANSTSSTFSRYDNINGHYWINVPHLFFEDGEVFDPSGLDASALTIKTTNSSNQIIDVDIVYNGEEEWKGTDYLTWWNEVESVAIHEIGHSIGLAHTEITSTPVPVMYYSAEPSSNRRELKLDDQKGVAFLYGGNLIDNETFSNVLNYFYWNLTIPTGKTIVVEGIFFMNQGANVINYGTLDFRPNSMIYFSGGGGLINNGTLSAVGTSTSSITFDKDGSTAWGGIQFNSGSSGNLQYCSIQNAGNGIYCYNSSPTIKHSTIDNNSSTGLYLNYYSSPVLVGNNFRFNGSYGIRCESYSSPNLTDNGYPGSNVIRNNGTGILTSYYSNPNLLGYMTYGNSVFDNTGYEISASSNCTINARKVFWGTYATVSATGGSTIDNTDPLGDNPNDGRKIVADNSSNSITGVISLKVVADELSPALEKQKDKKYDEAIPLFLEVFKNNKDALLGKYALSKIEECYTQAGKKDYLDFSRREIKPLLKEGSETYVVALELETHQMVNLGLYKEAVNNLETILKKYNLNGEIEKNTLFTLGAFHNIFFGDKANSDKYFEELKQKYPNAALVNQIEIVKGLGLAANSSVQSGNASTPLIETAPIVKATVSEDAIINYPNPFNPTTKISFTLKNGGKVSLKVYDVLGKEVANLAEGYYEAGKHVAAFDGSNLASGIYLYRLVTPNATITKKMVLTK